MSKKNDYIPRFIKLIDCEQTEDLIKKNVNAFLLLTLISLRAKRSVNKNDNLLIGEARISNYKNYGLTEKKYRNALRILVEMGHIKIVATNRSKNNLRAEGGRKEGKKRATSGATSRVNKRATSGTIVKLLSSNVYDINLKSKGDLKSKQKGDLKGDFRATSGRPQGDLVESRAKEYKNNKNDKNKAAATLPFKKTKLFITPKNLESKSSRSIPKNNEKEKKESIEKNDAESIAKLMEKRAEEWGNQWCLSPSLIYFLIKEYEKKGGSKFVLAQVQEILRREKLARDNQKNAYKKQFKIIENPEIYLRLACKENYANFLES